jgi:hypothetical protein
LENPVPSQAGHLISATASFDLSLFIKITLQKEPWYPSRSRPPGWRKMLHKRTDFAARPAIQQKTPTDAKNTAAIQTPESESLPVETAIKMISAAIQHTKAIARLHQ